MPRTPRADQEHEGQENAGNPHKQAGPAQRAQPTAVTSEDIAGADEDHETSSSNKSQ